MWSFMLKESAGFLYLEAKERTFSRSWCWDIVNDLGWMSSSSSSIGGGSTLAKFYGLGSGTTVLAELTGAMAG
jgi:hypothetical protein